MKNHYLRVLMTTLVLGSLMTSIAVPSMTEVKAAVIEDEESTESTEDTERSDNQKSIESLEDTSTEETIDSSERNEAVVPEMSAAEDVIQAVDTEWQNTHSQLKMATASESGFVSATPEEIAAANEVANTEIGFNPEEKVVEVADWSEFRTAYNDGTVTKIILTTDISNSSNQALNLRRTSIEIDGRGHTLHLNRRSLEINSPTDGTGFFHIHDMVAQQRLDNGLTAAGYYAFVNGTNFTSNVAGWTFRTGNITTVPVNGNRVGRFIRAYQSEVQVYGKMSLHTTEENYYAGSVVIDDKTDWYGEVTYANYSAVWFVENSTSSASTSKSQEFTIGDNSRVVLKNSSNGTTYPAVFHHYASLTVGENSIYNANMNGNAVRFDQPNSQMTIKDGAVVNLLSRGNGEVLQYSANNSNLTVEPGGSLYIVGNTTGGVVNLQGAGGHTLTLDNPAGFDIRNNNDRGRALAMNNATNVFSIKESDIDLWNVGKLVSGPSQETYALVDNFSVKNGGGTANVTTSEPSLSNFTVSDYRRIAGMNTKPEVQWSPVTDADKSYQAKVLIGYTPGNTFDEFGNVVLEEVFASANQAKVTYTDTFGETHEALTADDGYATFTDTRFNEATREMFATAVRGPWESEEAVKTTVIDVTPPEPAKVDKAERVSPSTKELTGTGEVNANVSFTLNGVAQPAWNTTVNNEGRWLITIPEGTLTQDDKIQIILQDKSGAADLETPPITNNEIGNSNPVTDLNYSDATFKAGTIISVNGTLTMISAPANVAFGSLNIRDYTQLIGADKSSIDDALIIEDTRGARDKWEVTVQVVEEMTNDGDVLVGAMKYHYNNQLLTLTASPQTIYRNGPNDLASTYNITNAWGKGSDQNGLKIQAKEDVVPKTNGSYTGTVKWSLRDTIE